MGNLKPCPFCGGDAKVKGICGSESVYAFVYCENCKSRTAKTFEFDIGEEVIPQKELLERAKNHVVTAWNARVQS